MFTIQSLNNKKYITNLFEDKHNKIFQAKDSTDSRCYKWETEQACKSVADNINSDYYAKVCKVVSC